MATDMPDDLKVPKRIIVMRNGPYVVEGEVPLVRKTQIVSEYGEPLSWRNEGIVPTSAGKYRLCRCGQSSQFPFCDDTHETIGFDGSELADSRASARRALPFPRGTHITVKKDPTLCMDSGYCGLRDVGIAQLVTATNDTKICSLVIAMVERCPSGAC